MLKKITSAENSKNMAGRSATPGFTQWWWIVAIIVLSLFLRMYKLTDASIWSDEAFSLEMITYPFRTIWILSGQDVHPPLHYFILKAWVGLVGSNSLVWVRGLSVIFGVLTVSFGIWLMLLISTRRAASVAGLLLAVLPIAVRYSQDVRMYSMLGALLLGATIAFVYWVMYPSKTRYLVAYAFLMVAGFYTHYFSIFAVGSHWLYLLLIRLPRFGSHRHIEYPGWWLTNVMMAVLYIPWLPSMLKQFSKFGTGWILPLSLDSLPSAIWKFLTANDGHAQGGVTFWLVPLVYWIVAVSVFMLKGDKYRFNVLVVVCALLTMLAAALSSLAVPVFVERYLFFSALMLPMVLALALERVRSTVWFVSVVFLVLAIEVGGMTNIYRQNHTLNNPYRVADNQLSRLMSYFDAVSIEGDVLVVGDVYIFYAAKYYDTKYRKIVLYLPAPKDGALGPSKDNDFFAPMLRYSNDTYIGDLDELKTESHRVWLLPYTDQLRDNLIKIPGMWRLIRHEAGGDNVLNLYVICSSQTRELSECR
ncbi:glycosyltransferase family 39 protein [Pseudomonas sp. S1_E04]